MSQFSPSTAPLGPIPRQTKKGIPRLQLGQDDSQGGHA